MGRHIKGAPLLLTFILEAELSQRGEEQLEQSSKKKEKSERRDVTCSKAKSGARH